MKDQHVLASVMSSFWGAGLFTVLGFVSVALSEHDPIPLNKIGYAIGNVLIFAPLIFAVALLAFLAATLTLGRPAAWLLRRLMLDKPFPAALSGSALASIAAYALSRLTGSSYGWGDLAALIGPALSGGTAGLIYRRTLMPPRRPTVRPS